MLDRKYLRRRSPLMSQYPQLVELRSKQQMFPKLIEENLVSFIECLDYSLPQNEEFQNKIRKRKRNRPKTTFLLTSTPVKVDLEIKKTLKTMKTEKFKEKLKKESNLKRKKTAKVEEKKEQRKLSTKRKILNSSSSNDESLKLSDSDGNNDIFYVEGETGVTNELCLENSAKTKRSDIAA
ncbi:unnamed protein product [Acanthoscelides obtectus]|uniref:Uncharacterized protein n=1 Tax=Acanthoscelides obtectus TaxID=200917 RepID=A0A9P0PSR9_ACAOB|nr:unnamed protein product [Acanthoscelides obtectus]CAK1632229.1 hypothetical protein AOBTE_LOCUS7418 [Acanthoscelides obtectus]